MRVGVFGTSLLHPVDKQYTVSGHAQIPLKTASILADSGFNVDIITTDAPTDYGLPPFVNKSVGLKTVPNIFTDPRGGTTDRWKYVNFLLKLRTCISEGEYDIVHFSGSKKIGILARFLTANTNISESYMTYFNYQPAGSMMNTIEKFTGVLDRIYFLTDYSHGKFCQHVTQNAPTAVTRPGIIREFNFESSHTLFNSKDYVLFWRNAHPRNGADICKNVFDHLSTRYSETEFVFAVRHNDIYEPELETACANNSNLHLLRHPYSDGITIEKLLVEATVVVLPFRELSINPQFAILETLASGTPLVTTPIESNTELVRDGETGVITKPNEESVEHAVADLLDNPPTRQIIAEAAQTEVYTNWNWDVYKNSLQKGMSSW